MSIDSAKKQRGRPPVDSEAVNVRIAQPMLGDLDAWRLHQTPPVSRPEAIRAMISAVLLMTKSESS
jgi:hypothetical protein